MKNLSAPKPTIICLTPVKNESWIIERFLTCASLWADHIILADQNSTDNTIELARKFEKVIIVENKQSQYSEFSRQELLLREARKIDGPRLLITLDADECLTGNFASSPEWQTLLSMPVGTIGAFRWINIHEDFQSASIDTRFYGQWAFMDDGSPHISSRAIHSPRIPIPDGAQHINLNEIGVLHYNYVSPPLNNSKIRWYMCWELVNSKNVDAYQLYVKYKLNHQKQSEQFKKVPLQKGWLSFYEEQGIDMTSYSIHQKHFRRSKNHADPSLFPFFWWDFEVIEMMEKYGAAAFAQLDIWDYDWALFALSNGKDNVNRFTNPQTKKDKLALKWIKEISSGATGSFERRIKSFLLYRFLFRAKPVATK